MTVVNLLTVLAQDKIQTCKYCTDYKGDPKPILPENMSSAIRMPDGSYKCEVCQIEEIQNRIVYVLLEIKKGRSLSP
jgi:hypothetical protein